MDLHEIMIDGDSNPLTAFWLSGRLAPSLQNNRDKISKLIEMLERQLSDKATEINTYIAKHNLLSHNVFLTVPIMFNN